MKSAPVLVLAGTRPEAVKLAPVVRALRARLGERAARLGVTAQHRDMLDAALRDLDLRADFDLDATRPGQTPTSALAAMLSGLERELTKRPPAVVVVQGDTTTALAGALAAFHLKIPVAHVEAGLRTGDLADPFPEEANRSLIARLAALHFAPTRAAREHLLREGIAPALVRVTGNTAVDAVLWAKARALKSGAPPAGDYALVTLHRRESFGAPMARLFKALLRILDEHPDLRLIYPVHPNPQVRAAALREVRHSRAELRPPAPYLEFVRLMAGAKLILTDSGGIVEEAASLSKPVLILRETTERPELVAVGGALIAGTTERGVAAAARRVLGDPALYKRMTGVTNPYGDGRAAERVAAGVAELLRR